MKKITQQLTLALLGLIVALAGCDAAKNAASDAANNAAGQLGDMANIDFGDFDATGLKDKFAGITDGFKDVTAENVDGLTSKISDLSGSIDGMGIADLPAPAKTAVGGMITPFIGAIKTAMEGISDEGILGKLKPVVEPMLEKLTGLAG